ncbi:hypothetical protein [Frondihabitans sp. Leaf304]|uniref:hypothetical protein n=1 Tax=Frondihabitans sp. Leaf304 TaxID=1736329 RepID=UPI0012F7399B|nr:hypothetical protein [Frondihabitans sp. Leaf304]
MNEEGANRRIGWQMTLLRSIEAHAKTISEVDIAPAGSELASDDLSLAPHYTSHLVTFCLGIAHDAFHTARIICDTENGNRIPFIGLYPLLRTAMEASALCTWVLAPDPQSERLRRSLGARWSDVIHDDQAVRATLPASSLDDKEEASSKNRLLKENSAKVRAQKSELRKLAERLDLVIEEHRGVPGFGPMFDDIAADVKLPLGEVRGSWHFISGLTHPSLSRATALSDIRRMSASVDGVFKARMTANSETVALALDAALVVYIRATGLVEKRGGLRNISWPQPGDINPAPVWNDTTSQSPSQAHRGASFHR